MGNITGKTSEDCERNYLYLKLPPTTSWKTTDKRDQCMLRNHAIIYLDQPTHVFAKVAVQV